MILSGQSPNKFIFMNGSVSPNHTPYTYDYLNDDWSDPLESFNPGGNDGCQVAYDSNNKKLIVITETNGQYYVDAYDPLTDSWESRETLDPEHSCCEDIDESVAYDIESDKTILCIFTNQTIYAYGYDYLTDSWTQKGSTYVGNHTHSALAYDIESDRMIYTSWVGSSSPIVTKSFDYNSNTWESKSDITFSGSISDLGMTYDSQNDKIIMAILKDEYIYMNAYDYNSNSWIMTNNDDSEGTRFGITNSSDHIDLAYDPFNNIVLLIATSQNGTTVSTYSYTLNADNLITKSLLEVSFFKWLA